MSYLERGAGMEVIREWWQLAMAATAGLVWLIRLESRATANTREIARLWAQRKEDLDASKEARDHTNAKLDRMEEKLDKAFQELRSDIKSLIRREG